MSYFVVVSVCERLRHVPRFEGTTAQREWPIPCNTAAPKNMAAVVANRNVVNFAIREQVPRR